MGPGGFKFKLLGPGPLAEMETDAGGPARGREELWPTTMRPAQLRGLEARQRKSTDGMHGARDR